MSQLDPRDPQVWRTVRATVARAQRSSLHCAIASSTPDGRAHVSPIGSVRLLEPGHGIYLDVFNAQLGRDLAHDPQLTILAVDSSRRTWLRALGTGRFPTPPGVRLVCTAGPARPASDDEIRRFRRAVRPALLTPGGRAMFGRTARVRARDLTVTAVIAVRIGALTRHVWHEGIVRPASTPPPRTPPARSARATPRPR